MQVAFPWKKRDERYICEMLAYGASPNAFVAEQASALFPLGAEVVELGAGEGRNAVFLADEDYRVTVVNYAKVGRAKAAQLAPSGSVESFRPQLPWQGNRANREWTLCYKGVAFT